MKREALDYLEEWKSRKSRRPLVLRGSRQIGKSWLVRQFAKQSFDKILELNFEDNKHLADIFHLPVDECLHLLELEFNLTITPGKTLIFLDEIQAAPEVFARLRYFYEQKPELHIIAAGSLLEFLLANSSFAVPVGRIEYMYLGPMNFREFLHACSEKKLLAYLVNWQVDQTLPESIHLKLRRYFQKFLYLGGMPESISSWLASGQNLRESDIIKESILKTYEEDFIKYSGRFDPLVLQKLFHQLPLVVGRKFKYSQIMPEQRAQKVQEAYRLLQSARVTQPIYHSSANGIPLSAEQKEKTYKPLFLDCGLMLRANGLSLRDLEQNLSLINKGALAEQIVGQFLLYSGEFFEEPQLHYWVREAKGSSAEVDYVMAIHGQVIPIEVKAGKTGSLKSLQQFIIDKKATLAVRFNDDLPSVCHTNAKGNDFTLISLPLYMAGEVKRLLAKSISPQES